MNTEEKLIIPCLTAFDWVIDLLTLGIWSRIRGNQKVAYKSKVDVE